MEESKTQSNIAFSKFIGWIYGWLWFEILVSILSGYIFNQYYIDLKNQILSYPPVWIFLVVGEVAFALICLILVSLIRFLTIPIYFIFAIVTGVVFAIFLPVMGLSNIYLSLWVAIFVLFLISLFSWITTRDIFPIGLFLGATLIGLVIMYVVSQINHLSENDILANYIVLIGLMFLLALNTSLAKSHFSWIIKYNRKWKRTGIFCSLVMYIEVMLIFLPFMGRSSDD